jgi:tetratricopeptide (TPR) repeat protein
MNQTDSERHSEAALRARIMAGSQNVDDYLSLSDILKSAGRDEEAILVYEQALRLHLTRIEQATVLTQLGALLDGARDQRDEARTLARKALELIEGEPETPQTLLLRGLSLSRIANVTWPEDASEAERIGRLALQVLERVIETGGQDESMAVAYFDAAALYSFLGDQERAVNLYQRYLHRPALDARGRVETLYMLAEALRLAERLSDAEEALQTAVRLLDTSSVQAPDVLVTLGLVQHAAGRPTEARESLLRALQTLMQQERRDRQLLRTIHGQLGVIEYDAGEYAKAADSFKQALDGCAEDGVDRHRLLVWLGDCHLAIGATAQARSYYGQVLDSPEAAGEEREHALDGLARLTQRS